MKPTFGPGKITFKAKKLTFSVVESENEVEARQQPPVLSTRRLQSLDKLRRYVEENEFDPKFMQMCHQFEGLLHQEQTQNLTHVPITQFMTAKKSDRLSIIQFFT